MQAGEQAGMQPKAGKATCQLSSTNMNNHIEQQTKVQAVAHELTKLN